MGGFFTELKRRHIYRVAAAYAVVAWLLLQLFNNLAPIFELPSWLGRGFVFLLLAGFPIALLFCWIQHLAPTSAGAGQIKTTRLDWVLAGGIGLVIAIFLYQQLVLGGGGVFQPQARVDAVPGTAAPPVGVVSLAVLPFTNLSGDATQEFFSDGMTEEITSALAKIPNLRVVGRTSAFQFKGENKDLRAIGQALSATHLIEGSVRKDGSQLRITAQLIKADDGTHVWTESFDRELKGVFAVQEEIAQSIAASLQVPLGLNQGEELVSNRTGDTDSYQDYLRARALVRGRGVIGQESPLPQAAKLLEQSTARDPNYAPAWGLLGQAYVLTPVYSNALVNRALDELRPLAAESLQKAEAAAQRAIQLDANNIDGHMSLAMVRTYRGKYVEAEDSFRKALSIDAGNPEALHQYALFVAIVGRLNDGILMRQRLQAMEPFVPVYNFTTGANSFVAGRYEEAIEIMKALPPSYYSRLYLAEAYVALNRYNEAVGALKEIPSGIVRPELLAAAIRSLQSASAQTASPQMYVYGGPPEQTLNFFNGLADNGSPALGTQLSILWASAYSDMRKTDRFKAYLRKAGFIDYWKARGWPDFCRPLAADDFVCN